MAQEDGVKYAITADQDKAVKKVMGRIGEEAWKEPVRGCGYELAETWRDGPKVDDRSGEIGIV